MASPRTTDDAGIERLPFLRSRIARRVVALFIVSALVPLSLCTVFLAQRFGDQLVRTQERNLDGLVRSFGMTVLARLGSADDVIASIASAPGASDALIAERAAGLPWVRSVRRIMPQPPPRDGGLGRVDPDQQQQAALQARESVLLWDPTSTDSSRLYLVRALPSGAWLYAEIASQWLWTGAREFAGDAGLIIVDDQGRLLSAHGAVPPQALQPATLGALVPHRAFHRTAATPTPPILDGHWLLRSWELFLGGRFHCPSWQLLAMRARPTLLHSRNDPYRYLFALILATILLIAWLSMTTIRRQLQPLAQLADAARRVGQRDFRAFEHMRWDDEFGDLARSFSAMSHELRTQFSTLETFSEVDRQLLQKPDLELILDTLLPQIASILDCHCVSVLLFDGDSPEHVRAYDYWQGATERLPVRRISTQAAAIKRACEQAAAACADPALDASVSQLLPATPQPVRAVGLHALRDDTSIAGALCIGYSEGRANAKQPGVGAGDFADRLSLILVNLRRAESLRRQANFDSLTGLQNRALFGQGVRAAVAAAQERGGLGGLLYLDLDNFKRVNDAAGHGTGDGLLRIVAGRLMGCADAAASVARLGGDEFAVLLPQIPGPDRLRQIGDQIIASLQRPIVIDGREHHVSASVGMTVFPSDGTQFEDLLKTGDIAMYQAKDAGRGRAVFFEAEMQRRLVERLSLESEMYCALENEEFRVFYQPIVALQSEGMVGVEALARWPGADQMSWRPPALFVPIAEENGLIVALGDWILRTACRQFTRWRTEGLKLGYVSVNVSVRQLQERDFADRVLAVLRDCGMKPRELHMEITESVLASGVEFEHTLSRIAAQGICVALDDFGTGYSSLSYLRTYPIHTVKIDRSFVQSLPRDPTACRLMHSILLMCGALDKQVIAEGVETRAQAQFLQRVGCGAVQGYLFGRPMEGADIPGFARELCASADGGPLRSKHSSASPFTA